MSENIDKSDEELVALTLKDKNHYRYLVDRYGAKLQRYIVRVSGTDPDDSADILQEVFLKAYRKLNDFDLRLKFSSWIYRIAHNEAVTHLRKASVRPKTFNTETNDIILQTLPADLNIEQGIDHRNLTADISRIIAGLDEKYRTVLVLRYMEDKDYKEISDILKKPAGTIATLLKRGREQLLKEIPTQKLSI